MDLLISHGADINAQNSWKITPITIAMLKNHTGIVKRMLDMDGVDVNGKDDRGMTLLRMALQDLRDSSIIDFLGYLIKKGADVNVKDVSGASCLHFLA